MDGHSQNVAILPPSGWTNAPTLQEPTLLIDYTSVMGDYICILVLVNHASFNMDGAASPTVLRTRSRLGSNYRASNVPAGPVRGLSNYVLIISLPPFDSSLPYPGLIKRAVSPLGPPLV
jgi:hypothetical protein